MGRVSETHLIHRMEVVNSALRGVRVVASGRNGYTALDLYDADGCIRTLCTGTKRGVYDYLDAMIATLEITNRI